MRRRFKISWPRLTWLWRTNLGRLVFALNLLALLVLVAGALVLNEFSQGLIETKKDSLSAQASLMGEVVAELATLGEPEPRMEPSAAIVLERFLVRDQHFLLYDIKGHLIADSFLVSDNIDSRDLPKARKSGTKPAQNLNQKTIAMRERARLSLKTQVDEALSGQDSAAVRRNERGEKVVSVAIPLKHVNMILGVIVLESGGVEDIINKQRQALFPFILIALLVNIASSIAINWIVSGPVQRLSLAADRVRLQKARAISLPDIEGRRDEIGALARALSSMTATLSRRMDEIDRFAADVSHEIKNPLTSIRSALETHALLKDEEKRSRLMAVINQDVKRIDRLVTDISNASRIDAEMARITPQTFDFARLIDNLCQTYFDDDPMSVSVQFDNQLGDEKALISGSEGPIGQVLHNLIDNARSFSPPGGCVKLTLSSDKDAPNRLKLLVDDDGPGIPPENLETVFERFYTSRPKGTRFGNNSGLGLSISRQIVDAHLGQLTASNRLGDDGAIKGARFTLRLKRALA